MNKPHFAAKCRPWLAALLGLLTACAIQRTDCDYWWGRIVAEPAQAINGTVTIRIHKQLIERELQAKVTIERTADCILLSVTKNSRLVATYCARPTRTIQYAGSDVLLIDKAPSMNGIDPWGGAITIYLPEGKRACQFE